ncbi:MAG: quinolinate synthase NadA [Candidatus Omnitrophica bacterium]|nr:quinolinate synthase NadA [Candidatus Omnitrophota bacterium]
MKKIIDKINDLKKQKNAVILAHNYQRPEVQDIADHTGDSLGLSIQAAQTKADIILFCGVYFMAETAKILSPNKIVLIPDPDAGCPMADMITADQLRELKRQHPKAKVVCYVNSPAEVKAESDVCCTSANAVEILKKMFTEKDEILFVPDKYLGSYAAKKAKRNVITWNGYCPTHAKMLPDDILKLKALHPEAKVMVHPECPAPIIKLADEVLSTAGMLRYAKTNDAKEFIVVTEMGMIYPLKKENPEKEFYPVSDLAVCPNMKRVTLEKVLYSLENMVYKIELPHEIMSRAWGSINRMLEY